MSFVEAVKYVSTPIALVAFIAAILASVYMRRFLHLERILSKVSPKDQSQAVRTLADGYALVHDNLSPEQRFELVKSVIANKASNSRRILYASIFFMFMVSFISVLSSVLPEFIKMIAANSDTPAMQALRTGPANGAWNIYVSCPQGAVMEPATNFINGHYSRTWPAPSGEKGTTDITLRVISKNSVELSGKVFIGNNTTWNVSGIADKVRNGDRFEGKGSIDYVINCSFSAQPY